MYLLPDPQWDRVRQQDPASDRLVDLGTSVAFDYTYPGTRPEGETTVPMIVGLSAAEVDTILNGMYLVGERETRGALLDERTYRVDWQSPEAGTSVKVRSTVTYRLQQDPIHGELISVPDIVGLTVEKGWNRLRMINLNG